MQHADPYVTGCGEKQVGPRKHLALAALRVHPALLVHLTRDALEVGLHHIVLDALKALLLDVYLLAAGCHHAAAGGRARAAHSRRGLRCVPHHLEW